MSILLLFVDGIGLGEADPAVNPFAAAPAPALTGLVGGPLARDGVLDGHHERLERDGVLLIATDAVLGVPGLPQSATGQTALLTGLNAPAIVGRHVPAYPTADLRTLLAGHSLFRRLVDRGRAVTLANAYTEEYYRALDAGRLRHGAITYAALSAGLRLRTVDDLRRGEAVFHDLTNMRLRAWGHDVPHITPMEAGGNLARLAAAHDLTVFEFFLADLAAHRRIEAQPGEIVEMLDGLISGIVNNLSTSTTFVLTSDHGNLEDNRTDVHTQNPVPTLVFGPARDDFRHVRAITDVAPAILKSLGCPD